MFGEFPPTSTISTVNSHHRSLIQMFYPQIVKTGKTPTGSLQILANWVSSAEYSPDLQVVYSLAFHHTNPVRWCQRRAIHLTSMQISQGKKWLLKMAHLTQTLPTKIGATSKFRSTLERSWDGMSLPFFLRDDSVFLAKSTSSYVAANHICVYYRTNAFFDKSWTDSPPNCFKTTLGGLFSIQTFNFS